MSRDQRSGQDTWVIRLETRGKEGDKEECKTSGDTRSEVGEDRKYFLNKVEWSKEERL